MAVMAILDAAIQTFQALETEILCFIIAAVTHAVVFRKYRVRAPKKVNKLSATFESEKPEGFAEGGHHPRVPGLVPLLKSIRPLLHEGADRNVIAGEFTIRLQKSSPENTDEALTGLLDAVGKATSIELLAAVRAVLKERALQPSGDLSERLLRSYLGLRLVDDFNTLLAECEAASCATPGILMLALRSAVFAGDLEGVVVRLRGLSAAWRAEGNTSPSAAPQYLLQQLARLALDNAEVPMILRELSESGLLKSSAFEIFLHECAQRGNVASIQETEKYGREQGVAFTAAAYSTLLRAAPSGEEARRLFAEAMERGLVMKDIVPAAAEAALKRGDKNLADAVLRLLPASPAPEVAAAMIRLCAKDLLEGTSVLGLYERRLEGVDVLVDVEAGRLVAEAALAARRPELLAKLLAVNSAGETPHDMALLKSFGAEHRLQEALAVFEACLEKSARLYNALLDVCMDCRDIEAAERIIKEACNAEMADVVTYNTLIKAHLRNNDLRRARSAMDMMRSAGFAPNCVTFNELIDASIKLGTNDTWAIIEEMRNCGVRPNHVTCSILLKSIQQKAGDIERTLELVRIMDDDMDEQLLSSVCEACIRTGRGDLLTEQLKRQRCGRGVQVKGAHSYGSIIRAFGFIQDMAGAWGMWREMRANHVVPTAITIGCMVEALVSNGDPEAGYSLIREVLGGGQTRHLVNAVIYCSVLKGFCHQKRFDRVWTVYEEMVAAEIQFSIVTYNALIDACARNQDMARVQPLLEDMHRQGIEPNVITYSTIVKGYCQENRIDKAFELFGEMKKSPSFRPDEITYNSLLDGCARHGFWDRGNGLLADMQRFGVRPSNFTLSVVVKLANRSKRPEQAFELCDELCKKYNIRPNVHVYNNLVHTCTTHYPATRRALEVFEQMLSEKVRPDTRTYMLLIKDFLSAGNAQDAAGLLRAAVGLQEPHSCVARFEKSFLQVRGLSPEFIAETLEGLTGQCGDEPLAMQLLRDLRKLPGMKLDSKLHVKLASQAIHGGS